MSSKISSSPADQAPAIIPGLLEHQETATKTGEAKESGIFNGVSLKSAAESTLPAAAKNLAVPFHDINFAQIESNAPLVFALVDGFVSDPTKIKETYQNQHAEKATELAAAHPKLSSKIHAWKGALEVWSRAPLPEKEERYAKLEELAKSMPPELTSLVALGDAMKIMDDADSYKLSFLKREAEIDQNSKTQKQPLIHLTKALHERGPAMEKNLQKFAEVAENVIQLHAQLKETSEKKEISRDPALQEQWDDAATHIQSAIKDHLLFAQQAKEGDFKDTRITFEKTKKTFLEARRAFLKAKRADLMQLRASYARQETEAIAKGNTPAAENFNAANLAVGDALATLKKITEDSTVQEVTLFLKTSSYNLQEAAAWAQGNEKEATNFEEAALLAHGAISAAERITRTLNEGGRFSESESLSLKLSLNVYSYRLQEAEATAQGNEEKRLNFRAAFKATQQGAKYFKSAFSSGASEKDYDILWKKGLLELQKADFFAQQKPERADKLL